MFTFPLACAVGLIALSFFLGSTQEVLTYEDPKLTVSAFDTSAVTADAFSVFVMETGEELVSQNETMVLPIASVTKLVTASALLHEEGIDTQLPVTVSDTAAEGRAGKLQARDLYSSRELLSPLLLESSNDAGSALLRRHSSLLEKMNALPESLGLSHTRFVDTTGLSEQNVSTAAELGVLLRTLYTRDRHVFDLSTQKESIGAHTGWGNNNPVSAHKGFQGGKHGFTEAAGRTLVAVFTETLASGEQIEVGYTLLHSDDLKSDVEQLREQVVKNVVYK
ncbi:MAG: hypothetical protein RLZZ76_540 [Candidatus Parcubacteria bacterium]